MKPDLVITAVSGYVWEQIRPFANSLDRSGFSGDRVVLAANMDPFTADCLQNRDFQVLPFKNPPHSPTFIIKDRFEPLLRFLEKYGSEYRYVVWVDAGDQIFQSNPTDWLEKHAHSNSVVAARECWRIKDELQFNDPWVKAALPDEYSWLREEEILCGGTVAGEVTSVHIALDEVYARVCAKPIYGSDQAFLNYVARRPLGFETQIPYMYEGWTATCSAFDTDGFHSVIGRPAWHLTDVVPIFDQQSGLVLAPYTKKPFVLVHQWNRDQDWCRIMQSKYGDF